MMGAQSALFSPAKMGSIPEMLPANRISAANGLIGLTTVVATVVGMAAGNMLSDFTGAFGQERLWMSALVLIGIAVVGWLVSLPIVRFDAANPERRFPWGFPLQTYRDVKTLATTRPLLRIAMGIMFFWSLGALIQLNIDQLAFAGGAKGQTQIVPMLLALIAGVGLGSVLAGIWSAGRIEMGLLPLGAAGIAISGTLLFTVHNDLIKTAAKIPFKDKVFHPIQSWTAVFTGQYAWALVLLFFLGLSAGMFHVPLASYIQHRSPRDKRGSILAAENFLTFTGVLVTALIYAGMTTTFFGGEPLFSPQEVFLVAGLCTIPIFFYIVGVIPQASIRFCVWLASKLVYRIRIYGRQYLPEQGGAVMVSNHISWIDGFLFLLTSSRQVRIVAWAGNFESRWRRQFARFWGLILIGDDEQSINKGLARANRALKAGQLVCVFPEGSISRSGQLQAFRPGLMKMLKGTDAPVIPVYLDELWGSIFSFQGRKFFWKWPRKFRYPISICFGEPIPSPENLCQVRRAVQDLGASAVTRRSQESSVPAREFIRAAKQRKSRRKAADSTGADLTGGKLLARTLVLRRLLRRHVLGPDEQYVGLLLPPSLAGIAANMALTLDKRVAVNLNFTVTSEVLNFCIEQCGITHVLTSRRFMEKMDFELDAELVYMEDFREKLTPTTGDKLVAATQAFLMPSGMLERHFGLHKVDPNDVITVIYTSGSTGTPKGVMLTHANIASNVEAIEQVVHLTSEDILVGALPLFHSFGYTITMWAVMNLNIQCVYHFSPLDGKVVGKMCGQYGVTILLATPTFLRTYLKRCTKEDFAKLEVVVCGAEKLPSELCDAFEEKFGVRPVEGYGATELSPLASVNVPPSRSTEHDHTDCKEGSVGRPVPGVAAKVTDLDSGEELGTGESGMLWIQGPNVMAGYLKRQDLTDEVIVDGWYKTGDVALIDDEGFIHITGRVSRFSKIGGEMVPHIKIEETMNSIIGAGEEEGLKAAVTAVPHPKKGERLIVVHTKLEQTPADLCKALSDAGLPNIFIPSADSFLEVDELPVLGSGKLDLKGIQAIAESHFRPAQ